MAFPRHRPASPVPSNPSFPDIEKDVLASWNAGNTFAQSVEAREGNDEWVFYDGPPFANGLPHYGHLLTGYAKDVFPRFHTMRGKQVHRRFGWDTHGLPAELEAERQLGITDKSQIEEMGIAAFNQAARESVLKYTDEWQAYVTRQARWVDFENDYKTLDITFMESVLWAFSTLYNKGLAYEGYRVLPYCWRDQTPLSNHELRMDDDVYKPRQDQSVTVTFPLHGEKAEQAELVGVLALAWTTTPWTLPTNAALAVGPEISYAVIPAGPSSSTPGARYLMALDTIANYRKELGYEDLEQAQAAVTRVVQGSDLGGIQYQRVFDYYADDSWGMDNAWQILVAEYVATGEGTGIVHQAPAYGEDDQITCAEAGIPVVISVDDAGCFLDQVSDVAGLQVFDANKPLTKLLRESGRLFAERSYDHSYPHCWRCRTPLIYKAVSSWFVKVTEIRDRMVELNQDITWVPDNVKDGQFGKWLANARDWSISRNRYWGSPIPVWKSDNPEYPRVDVYGSLEELARDFGAAPTDLHRPAIDDLVRPNPDDPTGKSMMRRIPDVLDVWFDSGSMPFAQVHYPFENQEWFDTHNPADFIVEYIGQTRGWFYTMHVLSTALFDRPAFSNVISHGIVLGSDGQKMSKSLRNYPDVSEVFDRDGADAMRWFLMSSSVIRGGNLVVTEEGIRESVRQFLLPLWSTYYFLGLYVGDHEPQWRTDSPHVLDRYILAKTRDVITETTAHFDALDAPLAAQKLRDFADVLTNWYVRRSRDRFWGGEDLDAVDTLYTVLETLCRLSAPLAPLITEEVWRGITGGDSVHLTDWPEPEPFPQDGALVAAMDRVRDVASAGLALRKAHSRRVRLPLSKLTVVSSAANDLVPFADIISEELNVAEVACVELTDSAIESFGIARKLIPNARALGPRVGGAIQGLIAQAKAGEWTLTDGVVMIGEESLLEGGIHA
jgi:isoleucyl-tRNA synthetase